MPHTMLCIGFEGTSVSESLGKLLDAGVCNVILFARNVESPGQVLELCNAIRRRASCEVLIGVDQEGGRVRRLRDGFVDIPSMRDLGRTNDRRLARAVGRVMAREIRAVGFDVDFAPVLDVDTNPNNPVIADRSLGPDAAQVAELGVQLFQGMQQEHVAACAKHFPGHGDTSTDSHLDLPRLNHDMKRLREVELVPFVAASRFGCASMMTSHVIFSPIDSELPATLSRKVMHQILRDSEVAGGLGYDGLVFSDDMEMKAIADHYGFEQAIDLSARAGVDVLMVCHSLDRQWQAIEVLGKLPPEIHAQASRRRDRLIRRFVNQPRPSLDVLDSSEHRQVMAQISKSIELADPTDRARWG